MTRANHAAAMDARRKLQEIAARDLGGSPTTTSSAASACSAAAIRRAA